MGNELLIYSVVVILSFGLSGFFRHYVRAPGLIDTPNNRSSHTIPTIRGGGVAIVISFLSSIPFVSINVPVDNWMLALLGAGTLIAIIGFLDDLKHVPALIRLTVHFSAVIWAVYWVGGFPPVILLGDVVNLGWIGHIVISVFLVWLLNLYNFMDGINGLAALEAVSVCICMSILYFIDNSESGSLILFFLLASATIGFTIWNFPKAKLFLGDVGSGFLGIILGMFMLLGTWEKTEYLWAWLIMLGVFIVDATVTLVRRLLYGEKVYQAHRSHAYQYASRLLGSHSYVTSLVVIINVAWLFPVACLVVTRKVGGEIGLVLAYVPLFVLTYLLKAGSRDLQKI